MTGELNTSNTVRSAAAATRNSSRNADERGAERLSRDEARWLATIAQRLHRRPRPTNSAARTQRRLHETIQALGCVQLDTISVVARSHETVPWSRIGPYDPALLAELHFPQGELFEYWAHAAALVPIESFPFYRRAMAEYRARHEAPGSWAAEQRDLLDRVLATVTDSGPLASRYFTRPSGPRPEAWAWWGGKPERRALDHLWSRGDLMVVRREGFERVYDLTERVVPPVLARALPTETEVRRHFVGKALAALGVGTAAWVADYFRFGSRPHIRPADASVELDRLVAEGGAVPVVVEGVAARSWLSTDLLPILIGLRAGRGKPTLTTLLSPFDSLVWHRGRTLDLFDFDYRLESYTPAARRRYGYYTLPILRRGRLIGRVDPLFHRRERVLTCRALHLEPGVRLGASLESDIADALIDLARFLGADSVRLERSDPPELVESLTREVRDSV